MTKDGALPTNQEPGDASAPARAAPAPVTPAVQGDVPDNRDLKKRTDWWAEVKGLFWLLLAVLGFHSFIAKPFYIPSESMLPGLLVGDRLVVTKYPYGWSFVSPTIPDPVAIFRSLVLRQQTESWGVRLPFVHGRLLGHMPRRGDVVIVTPPGRNSDYIKRVIGLPGETIAVRGGVVYLNGRAIRRSAKHDVRLAVDDNARCDPSDYPGALETDAGGRQWCRLPIVTETLDNGRHYDTVDLEPDSPGDNFPAMKIPAGHVFLMGDNRDRSADSRFPLSELGLGGAVPWENLGGRAEFITFSLDGSTTLNPLTWWSSLRSGRAGTSLHAQGGK